MSSQRLLVFQSERYPQADDLGVEPAQLLQPARGLEELNLDEPSTMQVLKKHSSPPWGLTDTWIKVNGLCISE